METISSVPCRAVKHTVSLSRMVHHISEAQLHI